MVARPRRNPTAQRGRAPARADGAADPPAEQPPDGPPAPDEAAAATDPGATAAAVKRKPPLERSASPKRQRTDGAAPDGAAKAAVDTAPASAEHQGSAATDAPILAGAGAGAVADEPPIEPQIGGDLSLEDTGIGVGLELALGLDSLGSDEDDDDDDDDDEEEEEEEDIGIGFGLPGAEADASGRDDDDDEDEDDDDDEGSFDEDDDDERGGDAANTESMRQALIAGWLERTHRTYHFNDNFDWPTLEAFLIKLRSMEAGVMELLRKGQIFFTLIPQAASSGAASGAASGAVHDKAAQGDLAGAAADGHPLHGESGADDEARAANGDSDAGGRDEDEDLAGSDAGSSRRPPAGAARQKAPIKVAVWAPHVIFPDTKFKCPECKGLIARESAQPDRLRRVTALANCYLLVTYRYRCSACKTQFQSTTEAFFDNLPANVRQTLPVTIFSRSCIDNELIDIVDEYGKTRKDRSNVNAMLNRKHRNCILHHPALRVTSITRRVSRKHGSGQPGADASARGHNMSDGEGDSEHAGDSGSRTPRHASGAGSRFGPGKSSGTRNRTLLPAPPAPSDTLTVVPLSMLLPGSDPSQSVPLYIPATAMHMLPQYLAMLHDLAASEDGGVTPGGRKLLPLLPRVKDGESIINVSPVTTNFSSRQQRKPSRCAVCLMSGCPGRYRRIKCTFYRLMDNPQFLAAKHYISTYDEMLELAKIFNGAGALPPPPQPRQRQFTPSGGDNRAAAAIAGLVDTPNISDLVAFFSMPEIKERLLALLPIKTAPGEGSPAAGESHAARAAKRKAADEDGDEGGGTADGDRQRPGAAYRNVKELAAAVAAAAVADTHERSSRKAAAASEEPEPAASPRHSPAAEPPPEPAEAAADAAAMTDDDDLGLDSESELEG
nr:hypothetical protein HK105_007078 [Polyrhizophydium stewartii]